jgi:hypothetical protein
MTSPGGGLEHAQDTKNLNKHRLWCDHRPHFALVILLHNDILDIRAALVDCRGGGIGAW